MNTRTKIILAVVAVAAVIGVLILQNHTGRHHEAAKPSSSDTTATPPPVSVPTTTAATVAPTPSATSLRRSPDQWGTPEQEKQILAAVAKVGTVWGLDYWSRLSTDTEDTWIGRVAPLQSAALTASDRSTFDKATDHKPWNQFLAQQCTTLTTRLQVSPPDDYGMPATQYTPTLTSQYAFVTATINTTCQDPDPTAQTPLPYTSTYLLHLVLTGNTWAV